MLVNGVEYDFTQIRVSLLGVTLAGVKEITYTTEQEKSNNKGSGVEPVSRGRGAKDYSGSLELAMTDVLALRAASPTGDLTDLPPFTIVVTYLNSKQFITDTLTQVEFTSDGSGGSEGDTDITTTLKMLPGGIEYGRP